MATLPSANQERTRVLVIGYVWPEPASSAASGHMMQILDCFLEQGWQVTFASPAGIGEHKADLAALGITEQAIRLNNASFDDFARQLDPHIVLFDRFMMEEQFGWRVEKHCPHALRVLESSDLQCLRDARQQALKDCLKTEPGREDFEALFTLPDSALFRHMSGTDIAQRELAAVYRCDLNLVISDREMTLLTGPFRVPEALLVNCPLMVSNVPESWPGFDQREHFLSIGNFRHAPNWDAVLWMKHSLWPLIRQRLPAAQLHIYGAYTPPKASALNNPAQGFLIKNWAEDALQVMTQARICLAPLRFGAGTKGKLLDAMLCGTPSVTTPIGVEGMAGEQGWNGSVSSSVQGLADAAVALYQDRERWQQAQTAGRQILEQRFSRQQISAVLIGAIEACRNNLERHRENNFTGAMLRHHQHKSTKYMAQWIAAKNREPG